MKSRKLFRLALIPALLLAGACRGYCAGTLKPKDSSAQPIAIVDHDVGVVIRDGFARTEVRQVFRNPNPTPQEALYSFPLPKSAALAEVTVATGDEVTMRGEVVARQKAREVYQEERDQGNDAAVAEKNGYQSFDFTVANVRPGATTTISFVYYQTLPLDTGVGRYLYPLEDGGTDDARQPFWVTNDQVENALSIEVELKSAYPVEKVFAPGLAGALIEQVGATSGPGGTGGTEIAGSDDPSVAADRGHWRLTWSAPQGKLDRDFVFYYALEDSLPGRIELVPYKKDGASPGTFMLVVTPGVDLKPLVNGADYTFVLDVSGSMADKLATLADGVARSLATLKAGDRFRIVTFNNDARILSGGFIPVAPETVAAAIVEVKALQSGGGTNLHAGVKLALSHLDADRAQSIVLVTDGVANIGEVDPRSFVKLLEKIDVRVFGFLLGNSANWPLMETIASTSGGFYESVSNQDDIATRLALAKPKLSHEAMHGVKLEIEGTRGCEVFDVDSAFLGNVYRGQQLVVFGRYRNAGEVGVKLTCRITGEEKTFETAFDLPATDQENPELERLFGLQRVERLSALANAGLADPAETETAIRDLGLRYQIVTDETSMLVLNDDAFARRGIARDNAARTEVEHAAQAAKAANPATPAPLPTDRRVDKKKPMFHLPSPSRSGAVDLSFLVAAGLILAAVLASNRRPA